jgi:hypothetical protein
VAYSARGTREGVFIGYRGRRWLDGAVGAASSGPLRAAQRLSVIAFNPHHAPQAAGSGRVAAVARGGGAAGRQTTGENAVAWPRRQQE